MLREWANGETFVSATMYPQQCVLVCQGLKIQQRGDMDNTKLNELLENIFTNRRDVWE